MSKKLILFGNGKNIKFVCKTLEIHNVFVDGFCVDDAYHTDSVFLNKPVYKFSEFIKSYSPDEYQMFSPMGANNRCQSRKSIYERFKQLNYNFYTFINPAAGINTDLENIGENVYIGWGAGLHPDVTVKDNCYIGERALIAHDTVINKHSYIGATTVIGGSCVIGECVSMGIGVIIRTDTTIVSDTAIGMGVLIHNNIEKSGTFVFSPLEKKWYGKH